MRKRAFLPLFLIKVLISASLIWLLLTRINLAAIWGHIRTADPLYIAATAPITLLTSILSAQRWSLISLGLVDFGNALRYTWIGMFYGALLPGGISGDVAKGASIAIRRRGTRVTQLPASILFDRLVGLSTLLFILCVCCLPIAFRWFAVDPAIVILCRWGFALSACALVASATVLAPTGRHLFDRLLECLPENSFRKRFSEVYHLFCGIVNNRWLLLKIYGLSIGIHLLNIVTYYLILRALATRVNIEEVSIYYAGMSAIVMAPISISGIGVREWFSLTYFTALGLHGELGVAFSWISLALGTLAAMVGGLIQLWELVIPTTQSRE